MVFGSAAFTDQVGVALEPSRGTREISRAERFAVRPSLDQLFAGALAAASCDALMRDAFRRHGCTLREIGDLFGRHPSTVWRRIRQAECLSPIVPVNWRDIPKGPHARIKI